MRLIAAVAARAFGVVSCAKCCASSAKLDSRTMCNCPQEFASDYLGFSLVVRMAKDRSLLSVSGGLDILEGVCWNRRSSEKQKTRHVPLRAPAVYEDQVSGEFGRGRSQWGEDGGGRRIAVLEQSELDREFIAGTLRSNGHVVVAFSRLTDLAKALFVGKKFDLLLVSFAGAADEILFGGKYLRRLAGNAATLLLLVRSEQLLESNYLITEAFSDFLLMPCEDCELVARAVRALPKKSKTAQDIFVVERFAFDGRNCTISAGGRCVRLQPRQFQLAAYLFRNANRAHSRMEIFRAVWGDGYDLSHSRTLDVHIARVRKLLMTMSPGDLSLVSIRRFGYCLYFNAK